MAGAHTPAGQAFSRATTHHTGMATLVVLLQWAGCFHQCTIAPRVTGKVILDRLHGETAVKLGNPQCTLASGSKTVELHEGNPIQSILLL